MKNCVQFSITNKFNVAHKLHLAENVISPNKMKKKKKNIVKSVELISI